MAWTELTRRQHDRNHAIGLAVIPSGVKADSRGELLAYTSARTGKTP